MEDSETLPAETNNGPAPVQQADFTPRSMQQLQQFAKTVSQSKMVPKKYRGRPQDIVVAVMHGMELNLPPLQALQSVAVINGRPSIYGDAALAVVRQSGLLADIEERVEGSGEEMTAYCRVKRADTGEEIEQWFSWEEAKQAGLTSKGGPWQDYPRRMMQMRARSWCLRDAFPEVLKGMMLAEEAEAIPQSNGETLDPKGQMDKSTEQSKEVQRTISRYGHTITPKQAETLDKWEAKLDDTDDLAAAVAYIESHIEDELTDEAYIGAMDGLLDEYRRKLEDESADDGSVEAQDADEVKEAAESVETTSDDPNDPEFEADDELPF